ncbi:hypothetical protein CXG81DRAFT_23996 [Caulochytrium protostelioides]|uniref:MSP domain-containing protein n=1 Tax=Caulochytrium protostelioides TaxID=1555241 RepID=A0A4P9XDU8_9FUNG|nr:hypothetical protein CXG81DRAFT_23996 [Caulochytrium protostelioides]|eukprot:RKP03340.1 hypothetical protein CXG81DRAFT_23996 [Caulochytrium protostelioides]
MAAATAAAAAVVVGAATSTASMAAHPASMAAHPADAAVNPAATAAAASASATASATASQTPLAAVSAPALGGSPKRLASMIGSADAQRIPPIPPAAAAPNARPPTAPRGRPSHGVAQASAPSLVDTTPLAPEAPQRLPPIRAPLPDVGRWLGALVPEIAQSLFARDGQPAANPMAHQLASAAASTAAPAAAVAPAAMTASTSSASAAAAAPTTSDLPPTTSKNRLQRRLDLLTTRLVGPRTDRSLPEDEMSDPTVAQLAWIAPPLSATTAVAQTSGLAKAGAAPAEPAGPSVSRTRSRTQTISGRPGGDAFAAAPVSAVLPNTQIIASLAQLVQDAAAREAAIEADNVAKYGPLYKQLPGPVERVFLQPDNVMLQRHGLLPIPVGMEPPPPPPSAPSTPKSAESTAFAPAAEARSAGAAGAAGATDGPRPPTMRRPPTRHDPAAVSEPAAAAAAASRSQPRLECVPPVIRFANCDAERTYTASLTLKNVGTHAFHFRAAIPPHLNARHAFRLVPLDLKAILAPGMTSEYRIEFRNPGFDDVAAEILVSNERDGPIAQVPIISARDRIRLEGPAALACGHCRFDAPTVLTFRLVNRGGAGQLVLSGAADPRTAGAGAGTDAVASYGRPHGHADQPLAVGPFTVTPSTLTLAKGTEVVLTVTFSPPALQETAATDAVMAAYAETLVLHYEDVAHVIPITAEVDVPRIAYVGPHAAVDPDAMHTLPTCTAPLAMPVLNLGSATTRPMAFVNKCNMKLPYRWEITPTYPTHRATPFSVTPAAGVVGCSAVFTCRFEPRDVGYAAASAKLILACAPLSDRPSDVERARSFEKVLFEMPLEGRAVSPQVSASPARFSGSAFIGHSFTQVIDITNAGHGDLRGWVEDVPLAPASASAAVGGAASPGARRAGTKKTPPPAGAASAKAVYCQVLSSEPEFAIASASTKTLQITINARSPALVHGQLVVGIHAPGDHAARRLMIPYTFEARMDPQALVFGDRVVAFGCVPVTEEAVRTTTLRNDAGIPLYWTTRVVHITGDALIHLEPSHGVLGIGEEVPLAVAYAPYWMEPLQCAVQFALAGTQADLDRAPSYVTALPLTGLGVTPEVALLSDTVALSSWPHVPLTIAFAMQNTGRLASHVTALPIDPRWADTVRYAVPTTWTLPPGAERTVVVRCQFTAPGDYTIPLVLQVKDMLRHEGRLVFTLHAHVAGLRIRCWALDRDADADEALRCATCHVVPAPLITAVEVPVLHDPPKAAEGEARFAALEPAKPVVAAPSDPAAAAEPAATIAPAPVPAVAAGGKAEAAPAGPTAAAKKPAAGSRQAPASAKSLPKPKSATPVAAAAKLSAPGLVAPREPPVPATPAPAAAAADAAEHDSHAGHVAPAGGETPAMPAEAVAAAAAAPATAASVDPAHATDPSERLSTLSPTADAASRATDDAHDAAAALTDVTALPVAVEAPVSATGFPLHVRHDLAQFVKQKTSFRVVNPTAMRVPYRFWSETLGVTEGRSARRLDRHAWDSRSSELMAVAGEGHLNRPGFLSDAGQQFLASRNHQDYLVACTRQYLQSGLGCGVRISHAQGTLEPYGAVDMTVECWANLPGAFVDQMAYDFMGVRGTLPLHITATGYPVTFLHNLERVQHVSATFGHTAMGDAARTVPLTLINYGPRAMQLAWPPLPWARYSEELTTIQPLEPLRWTLTAQLALPGEHVAELQPRVRLIGEDGAWPDTWDTPPLRISTSITIVEPHLAVLRTPPITQLDEGTVLLRNASPTPLRLTQLLLVPPHVWTLQFPEMVQHAADGLVVHAGATLALALEWCPGGPSRLAAYLNAASSSASDTAAADAASPTPAHQPPHLQIQFAAGTTQDVPLHLDT